MGRSVRVLVFAVPAAVCAVWTVFAGKDVNWDLLNYHYYLPFELLAGRLQQDFFAASAQSYLNPVGYLPFYLMVSSGWHSVLVSIALAVVHGLCISLLFLLSWRLFEHLPRSERTMFALLATGLGSATAVYWEMVGTSFLDPLLAPLMLAGLLSLLGDDRHALRRAMFAGVLFGLASALKYTNAVFALAALPLAAAMPGVRGAARWRTGLGYAAGGALAVAVMAGPWLVTLAREFGNPVFPLFNAWFRSPYWPPVNLVSDRFTLDGVSAALAFPFRMIALDRSLYSENFAPDLRFAALLLLAVALAAAGAMRKLSPPGRSARRRLAGARLFQRGSGAVAPDFGQRPLRPGRAASGRSLPGADRRALAASLDRAHRPDCVARPSGRHDGPRVAGPMVRCRAMVKALAAVRRAAAGAA